jgi:redox-sensitive bicupin YhaK (pirin superfamily)
VPPHTREAIATPSDHNVFAYVIDGHGHFGPSEGQPEQPQAELDNTTLINFGTGDHIVVSTGDEAVRFLLISGKPLNEPVAWRGPIVMNTPEELELAFEEYANGTFIKHTHRSYRGGEKQ